MRMFILAIVAVGFASLAGCGCLEKYTDPRFDDRPIDAGNGLLYPRDPVEFADPDQPGWHRCIFGTRWLRNAPGLNGGFPDPDQPTWQRQLFGPRYVDKATELQLLLLRVES